MDAADLVHRGPPEHHVGADAERRVEVVAAGLDVLVEDRLHVARAAGDHVVQVAVGLRRLDERDRLVDEERQRVLEEVRVRHEVGVEDAEVVALRDGQGVVDVAGLGAVVVEPAQVAAAHLLGQRPHLVGTPVVEEPGAVLPAQVERGAQGAPYGLDRLAVRRHEDLDGDPLAVEPQRPPVRLVAYAAARGLAGVEEQRLGGEVAVVPRVTGAREHRPHRQQGVDDEDGLGGDDHQPRQQVAAVGRVQQEHGVHEDAGGRQHGQHDQDRRVVLRGRDPAGARIMAVDATEVVVGHGGSPFRMAVPPGPVHPRQRP